MIIATFKLTFLFHNSLRNDKCKKYLMNNQDLPCIYFYFEKTNRIMDWKIILENVH